MQRADKLGLAQLHQLRGRIGRGPYKSWCVLVSDTENETSRERLKIMTKLSDGFAISEGDYLALEDGKLFGTDRSIEPLLQKLAEDAAGRNAEFVTIFFGEDVTEEEAQKAEVVFTQACPDAEISVLAGGQPVYYYIVSIE